MNFNDFKAWLDGFSEHIIDAPTPRQWERIRHVLESVKPTHPLTTSPVLREGFVPFVTPTFTNPIVLPNLTPSLPVPQVICNGGGKSITNGASNNVA